jgi:toxin-antitoxin system PIN domain toxin
VSYSVDANILLYASDRSSPHHPAAAAFLESRAEDTDLFCLCWTTLIAYLRIATHPRIFARPLSPEEAMSNVEALIELPRTHLLSEEEGFLDIYRAVTEQAAVRGNLVC